MVKIVFCIWHLQGEFNGSLKLAKNLKSLGHQVCYLGIPDSENNSVIHGFTFIPILEKWFPKGFLRQIEINHIKFTGIRLLIEQLKYLKYFKTFIHSFFKGENQEIYTILKEVNPDLLIISTCAPLYSSLLGLIAHQCKIPSIYLTDMFIFLPPPNTIKQEKTDIYLSQDFNFQEVNFTIKYHIKDFIEKIKKQITYFMGIDLNVKNIIRKLAINTKVPLELLDFSQSLPFQLPHLFLCPEDLDLPNSSRERCYYAEASIDLQRKEVPFSWYKLDRDKSLIYCTLGTTAGTIQALGIEKIKYFFQAVIDAMSLTKEYQLVLSVGTYISVENFYFVPANVIIVNNAPQLELIKRASLAIIAGGIHTVKECIFYEVPMIIFPVWADQPANAERVEYHGLGVVADIKNVSAKLINDLVETVANDLLLKQRLEAWGNKFREIEGSGKAMKYITKILEDAKLLN
ncbi:UDP-glucuronosyltransferase-like glycosyl transferase [Westiellopsis prolifica IICB1]|nr:UDP-glucuronosyltransferase-like glycosyl transferase [Westiellopsis prolifica IICB1]